MCSDDLTGLGLNNLKQISSGLSNISIGFSIPPLYFKLFAKKNNLLLGGGDGTPNPLFTQQKDLVHNYFFQEQEFLKDHNL